MTKFIPLVSNVEKIEKGKKAQDHEISVAVIASEIHQDNPKFYASRTGRLYDPHTGFNTVEGFTGNKLPEKLHEEFYALLNEARNALPFVREELAGVKNPEKKEVDTVEIEQLKVLIKSQEYQINELINSKNEDRSQEMKELKELLQAKTKEIESLKTGKNENKEVFHSEFTSILDILEEGLAVYLYGPAGTGKSNLAEQIARRLKLEFYPMSTVTQEFKFTGFVDGHGKYHETNFYKAVKNGGLFFIDEMDSCSSDVLVGLNACLANGYFDFPNETVQAHKDFRVISAGNTIGRGADDTYTGRQPIDLSTMDRFLAIKIDYDINIDMAVSKGDTALVNFANALRKASQETEITILVSYRALNVITKLKEKFELPKLINMAVLKGLAGDDIHMLAQNMDIDKTNKYYQAFKKAVA
jgi:DNA replication protein DnaC